MPTIYDVAKRAGVSPKTVSRAINGDAPVAEATREAIALAIRDLDYVPSHAARSMRSTKTGLVGMITGAVSGASDASAPGGLPDLLIVQTAQSRLEQSGKALFIADSGGSSQRVPELIMRFQAHRVEGMLFVAEQHKRLVDPLPWSDTKKVLVNCFDDEGTPAVLPDDEGGQFDLVEAVLAKGHKRIAFLTLADGLPATQLRMRGYQNALTKAGVAFDPDLVLPADLMGDAAEHELIADALDKFFALPSPPTAICCGNDRLAVAVYGVLRARGITIPDDVSVVGFDDYRVISETLYPKLTTAELPYAAMGQRAAEILTEILEGAEAPAEKITERIKGRVVVRESLVPPPANTSTNH